MDPLVTSVVGAIVGALAAECFRKLLGALSGAVGKARRKKAPAAGKHFRRP